MEGYCVIVSSPTIVLERRCGNNREEYIELGYTLRGSQITLFKFDKHCMAVLSIILAMQTPAMVARVILRV